MRYLFILFITLLCTPAHAETYSIATGSPSGIYYPFGGGLAALWSDNSDDINMKAEVTNGSVTNLIQVAKGESEVGISQADAFHAAINGKGKFPDKMPLSVLFALYPNLVHLIVPADSPIQSVQELKGKRVSLGAPGSGNLVTARALLDILGLSVDDLQPYYLSYTETAGAIKDGTIDAGFIVGGIGVAAVTELALVRDIRLIAFSDEEMATLNASQPAYTPFDVPAGLYAGVDEPVQTISLWNYLVVRNDLPNELAYRMVQIPFTHLKALQAIAYPAKFTTPENTLKYASDYLHPAAQRYFAER